MDFLKRHYEKFILLGLFVLFILLMLELLQINQATQSVQEADLMLPRRKPDHEVMNPDDEQFHVTQLWKNRAMNWKASVSRGEAENNFSDLVAAYELSLCPHCTQRNKEKNSNVEQLIPFTSFGSKCPVCGKDLPEPVRKQQALRGFKTKNDLDGDGIPNDVEKKFHLDPNNPDDALIDSDGDGFSNFYEISQNTDPTNAASHPPFWYRLYLADIKQVELPIRFMALNDNNSENKADWQIQYNIVNKRGKLTSRFAGLGETIEIEKREYRIDDLERIRIEEQQDAKTVRAGSEEKAKRVIDKSKVSLVEVVEKDENGKLLHAPDRLTMTVGQPVYSSDKRPLLSDSGLPEQEPVQLKTGSKVRVAGTTPRTRRVYADYIVEAIDAEKMTVSLRDAKARAKEDGSFDLFTITKEGEIPENSRVVKMEGNFSMDGVPEGGAPMPEPIIPLQPRRKTGNYSRQ